MHPAFLRAVGTALLLVLSGCAFTAENNPITGGELTVENEREMTADVAAQIRAQLPIVNDPVLLAYVNGLGQRIVAITEPQPFIYRFTIIEDESLNAFTIGGGHVYMNSGVIASAGDTSELVGVLAHEVAHVRQRHIARRGEGQGVAMLATLAAVAAVALSGGDPALIALAQGVNVALQLKNTRAAEAEADHEAIGYMVKAGYDPDGLSRFFERLVAAYPNESQIPAYLYSHPAVKERIAATRVEMDRRGIPHGASYTPSITDAELGRGLSHGPERDDERLREMQARLAQVLEPVAGGSGLYARPTFDRSITDPLLDEARVESEADRLDAADLLLARAEEKEPNDPRVALARADLAEEQRDWATAKDHLTRAFELDPNVALVQYRLGLVHKRLDNRTRAVFYLEQAASSYRAGSASRKRAEFEIQRITFKVLDRAKLRDGEGIERTEFRSGDTVVWWGDVARRFMEHNPVFELRWTQPDGSVAKRENVRMNTLGNVSGQLDTTGAPAGTWAIEVMTGDTPVDWREFHIMSGDGSRN